jgi:hypothetical protein
MNNFLHLTRTIDSQHGDGKSQEGGSMTKLLDSYSDMEIGQEIEDIASDLQIMVDIQHDQSSVIKDFVNSFERTGSRVPIKEGMISTKKPKKTRKSTLQGPTVGYNSESSSSDSRPSRPTMSDELGLEQTKKLALAVYNSSLEKGKWIVDLQESLSHVQLSVSPQDRQ